MEIGEEDLVFAQRADFRGLRFLDLDDQLGCGKDVRRPNQDLGARVLIGRIVEADAGTGAALDHHLVTVMDQLAHAPGNQTDTVFVAFHLFRNADQHRPKPSPGRFGRAMIAPGEANGHPLAASANLTAYPLPRCGRG